MQDCKIVIIGAGVVGLAIAYKISKDISEIIVLEKEDFYGRETSSRNSEVIHAGLYYKPGSLKAQTCIEGRRLLYDFCQKNKISHKKLGKLVVAHDKEEIHKIESIYQNARSCGVTELKAITSKEIKALEPNIKAERALYSPESGIVDTHSLMSFLHLKAKDNKVMFSFSTEAVAIEKLNSGYKVTVKEPNGDSFSFNTGMVINSAGIHADKVASMVGIDIEEQGYKINYCKGQYFRISNPRKFSISHLIYPPPTDLSLGIHITPDLGEGLRLGPDAEYVDEVNYDIKEADRHKFFTSVSKFLPGIVEDDLIPDTAGIRAKLQKPGEDFHDFVIKEESKLGLPGFINLVGIESPGLTACLSIAGIVKTLIKQPS
ncbi:MAG: NAD(P)/FAD-dependent oxidoreductase [Candidatus Omnitrophica bacterium]|nr:NAD(P)/FAD-dependent oxidoreductase [Candidatus Omnitrophota bacterium]